MRPIDRIIELFGGMSKLAQALAHEYPTTVQGWRDRGNVPSRHIPKIIEAAKSRGIKLSAADFFDITDTTDTTEHSNAAE